MDRTCNTCEWIRNAYKILIRKTVGKRPLGRPKRRWEDSIKVDLKHIKHDATNK
jgi:hypothetical protein